MKGSAMATLTVWKINDPSGAEQAIEKLESLQTRELIKVHDAAIVSWEEGKKKPKTRQLHNLAGAGALGGAFWGLLFGLIFFIPLLGLAMGAAAGALAGSLTDVGIDDRFIAQARDRITPGTSALFLLTSDAVLDKVEAEFDLSNAELLYTNLSTEDETKLRETFAEEE
jgi:uncharacterized membrane protein